MLHNSRPTLIKEFVQHSAQIMSAVKLVEGEMVNVSISLLLIVIEE